MTGLVGRTGLVAAVESVVEVEGVATSRGTGLASIFALVAIVVGIPIGLARFAAQWLPTAVPTLDEAGGALGRPMGDEALLTGLTLAAWVLWALFTFAVAVELVPWGRHAPSPSFRRAPAAAGPSSRQQAPEVGGITGALRDRVLTTRS